jgi:hypothetical protein
MQINCQQKLQELKEISHQQKLTTIKKYKE